MKKSRTVTQAPRASIVANASVMILKKGLASVGMREVMAASHLTQGGFYRARTCPIPAAVAPNRRLITGIFTCSR